jgi:crotonobetainyl-CoA:carnitine CoA-transferase CaiB-like acyl-CoA transferase
MVVTLFVIGTRIPMTFLHFQGPPTTTFMLTAMTFDPTVALNDLLADVDLSTADAGGRVTFAGQDPTIAARHRLAAPIGIPMMGNAVAAAALHRHRGGTDQDLHLDLRQAVHHINPSFAWKPTLAGEFPSIALVMDNPFALIPFRTRDGRTVMASAVYPHQAANWCRFLDVPPDIIKVAEKFSNWDAVELEDGAKAAGLPACVARTPEEWLAHPHGSWLAAQPVIGLTRIGDAPPRELGPSDRPFGGVRVLSFTHAIAGPTVGRVLAEQGANVSDLDPVIHRLSAEHPGVAVLDTRVVLRSLKSWGRLLGLDGRARDVVPVDLWALV